MTMTDRMGDIERPYALAFDPLQPHGGFVRVYASERLGEVDRPYSLALDEETGYFRRVYPEPRRYALDYLPETGLFVRVYA
jgi:hypothetical protein